MSLRKYKRFLAGFTLPLGFTVQRVPPMRRFKPSDKGNPVYIEFIGASGVGKTTLYKQIIKKYNAEWIDIRHFEALKSHKMKDGLIDSLAIYQDLARYKVDEILEGEEKILPGDKLGACRTSYNIIMQDALVYLFNKQDVILSEEGLFQFYSNAIEKLYNTDRERFEALLKGRALVYCYGSPELITERVLKRAEKTGHLWFKHKGASGEELEEVIRENIADKERLIDIVKKYIPVLEVNAADTVSDNKKKISHFIKNLNR